MNAEVLYQKSDDGFQAINLWKCNVCKKVYNSEDVAERCCAPKFCSYCNEQLPKDHYYLIHTECLHKRRFQEANKVSEWDGFVFDEKESGPYDGFYENVSEVIQQYEDEGILHDLPEFVFVCNKNHYEGIDIRSCIENSIEDMYEDAFDQLIEVEELEDFVKQWNKKQTLYSWEPNFKTIIVIDRKKVWEDFIAEVSENPNPLEEYVKQKDKLIEILKEIKDEQP